MAWAELAYPVALQAPIYTGVTSSFSGGCNGQRAISKALSKGQLPCTLPLFFFFFLMMVRQLLNEMGYFY